MKSTMTNSQKTADLKRLAYQCAEQKNNGCNDNCGSCPLNVSLYLDDPREAVLIRTNAEIDYQHDQENEQARNQVIKEIEDRNTAAGIGTLIGGLIPIGLIIWLVLSIKSCIFG